MTDITPVPQPEAAPGLAILSVDQVLALEQKCRENKAAQLRNDPLPHAITPEMMRQAVDSVRAHRGTLSLASKSDKKGSKAKSIVEIDLNGL